MSGTAVVDASLAVQWVLDEPYTAEAIALLTEWERDQIARVVPCWFAAETAAVLHRRVRLGQLSLADARQALEDVLAAVTIVSDSAPIANRAIEIALSLNQSRPYDALYAALAERYACALWTADERFYNAASPAYRWVRWIGSFRRM